MPNSTPPSRYITLVSEYTVGDGPRFVSAAAPLTIPNQPSTNFGASFARRGKMNASAKVKAAVGVRKPLIRTKPARPNQPAFHLPGVDARNTEHPEDAHGH